MNTYLVVPRMRAGSVQLYRRQQVSVISFERLGANPPFAAGLTMPELSRVGDVEGGCKSERVSFAFAFVGWERTRRPSREGVPRWILVDGLQVQK